MPSFAHLPRPVPLPRRRIAPVALGVFLSLMVVAGCGARGADREAVSDAASLRRAITSAPPGSVIRLAGGFYGPLDLSRGRAMAGPLTIVSENPADPAIFTSITARGVNGLNLAGMQVVAPSHDPKRPYLVHIENGSDIRLDHVDIKGAGGAERYREYALWLRNVSGVEVRNSRFRDTRYGVGMLNGRNVTLADNEFSGLQTDGIRGGGVSDLAITGNVLTDFSPKPGEHPDGIQFWSTNQKEPARRITIRDNVVARGTGGMTQGIFVRDTMGQLPFEDVVIEGNLIVGSMYNGIAVLGLRRGRITNNRVVPYPDQKAWIRTDNAVDVSISGNAAPQFLSDSKAWLPAGNQGAVRAVDRAGPEVRSWLAKRRWLKDKAGPHLSRLAAQ